MSIVGIVESYFASKGYQTKLDGSGIYVDPKPVWPKTDFKVTAYFWLDGRNVPMKLPTAKKPKPIDKLDYGEQFDRLYGRLIELRQLQPDVTPILHTFLFMDLEEVVRDLPFQNRQKIPSNFVKRILQDAIVLSLDDLKNEMKKKYVSMVSNGYSLVDAFEETIKPFGELIQALQANTVPQHILYSKIETHLKDLDSQITAQIQKFV